MKIKRYIQFIKESVEDIENNPWKLSEDEILEFFTEITDNGYIVDVEFGVVDRYRDKEIFSKKVIEGSIRPAYFINLITKRGVTDLDVTDDLKFAVSIITDLAEADFQLYDYDSKLDIDSVQIKRGIFVNSGDSFRWTKNHISIFVKQKVEVGITQKQLSQYYGWSVALEKDGRLFAEMDLEDMADYILSRSSSHKDSLVKGQENMWEYYDIGDYYPDINSLFEYTLNSDNSKMLVKSIIGELGGYKKTINFIGDKCSDKRDV